MDLSKGQKRCENVFVWEIVKFPSRDYSHEEKWFRDEVNVASQLIQSSGHREISICYDDSYWVPVFFSNFPGYFHVSMQVVNEEIREDAEIAYRLCIENDRRKEMWTTCVTITELNFNYGTSFKNSIPTDLLRCLHISFLERREKYFFKLVFYKDDGSAFPDEEIQETRTAPPIGKTDLKEIGAKSLTKHLSHLLIEDGDNDHDVTIKVKDKELKAHRLILKARSPVFKSMFGRETAERNTGLVQIDDCDPDAFADFLLYLYSGGVTLTGKNVANLYRIADKYAVVDLAKSCADYMIDNFTVQSVTDYLSLAAMHNEAGVLEIGIEFMGQHLKEVLNTKEWKDFISGNPLQGNEIISKAVSFIS